MFVPRCVLLWTACLLTADPVLSPEHPPEVRAKPGETVPLQCQGPRNASITAIKWSRPDLKPEGVVFFFRENRSYEGYQHSSFHGRVELRDPEMKDGDVSVVLKNVAVNDTGTYECLVSADSDGLTEHVRLTVTDSDPQEVRAKPGETVPLQCRSPRNASITAIEWSRPDLKPEGVVFFFRENRSYERYQHSSFHGRVELRDPEMKDGDASVVLKNVAVNDTGTYECLVSADSGDLTKHVRLTVTDSGDTAGNIWLKVVAGLTVSGLVLFIIGVCCYLKYKT